MPQKSVLITVNPCSASFLCNMVLDGIGYSFGILLKPLMEHFGVGKGLMSLVSVLAIYQYQS